VPFVGAAIVPIHFTVAFSVIVHVTAFKLVSAFPRKDAHAMFRVILEISQVKVGVGTRILSPLALTIFKAFLKFACVRGSSLPLVLALSSWFSLEVLARVDVTISEDVGAHAVLEAVDPFAFITVSVLPLVDAVAFNERIFPFTNVGFSIDTFPNSKSMLEALRPLSVVDLAIRPRINAFPLRFIINKLAYVLRTVRVQLESAAISAFADPLALVNATRGVEQNAEALSFSVD
jgi:hypothetical protein